ncbi:M20/M25/M40 family metallo-hydrolase [Sphingomonas sp. AP4-R1]|uniref:M20/M25/M40 family metallo-hydrolase n=1 Tax=Sphingomonas sp. AP4-R1 TaxID=2735134 RepID=UPI0020A354F8|nr:M20/M25/M40 family metallo-hydrolase [Sphingomonas sp. AP4-R1]
MPNSTLSLSRRDLLQGVGAAGLAATIPNLATAATRGGDVAAIKSVVARQHDDMIRRLRDWIALPTIAAERRNLQEGAQMMSAMLTDAGFQHTEIIQTPGTPAVFATLDAGAAKTLGVYAMYDVKQYDGPGWIAPPLEGRIVEDPDLGKIMIARGAINTKGPQMAFLAALHAIRAAGRKLPVNIVLIAEGEEEVGSVHLEEVLNKPQVAQALSRCTGMIYADAAQSPSGDVTLDLGSKGMLEVELTASSQAWGRGAAEEVHSGYAAAIDSPVWHLVQALATMTSPDGTRVTIDGWYDDIRAPTPHELALLAKNATPSSEESMKKIFGVRRWLNDVPYPQAVERLANAPTANIEGIYGGYTGPGGKTSLPARGVAKMDFRLVPNQTAKGAEAKLRAHLAKHGFGDIDVKATGGVDPSETREDTPLIAAVKSVYAKEGVPLTINPRNPTSGPTYLFTNPPFSLAFSSFGLGHGARFHVPNEYYVIEPKNPLLRGFDGATSSFVELLYALA